MSFPPNTAAAFLNGRPWAGTAGGLFPGSMSSAQLFAALTDPAGSGQAVFNVGPPITYPASILGVASVDVTTRSSRYSISADTVFTFTAVPPAGTTFGLVSLKNTDAAAHVITIPNSYSYALGAFRTSFTLAPGMEISLQWFYDNISGNYYLRGDVVRFADLNTIVTPAPTTDWILAEQNGVVGKMHPSNLTAGAVTNLTVAGVSKIDQDVSSTGSPTLNALNINGGLNIGGLFNPSGNQSIIVGNQNFTTNTTLAGVTGMFFTLNASGTYKFRAVLHLNPDAVGGQKIRIGKGGTGLTASFIRYQVTSLNNTANTLLLAQSIGDLGVTSAAAAGGTSDFTTVEGSIQVGVAGNITVEFAQSVANGTTTILAGSYFEIYGG